MSLDLLDSLLSVQKQYFNPQGSREPRPTSDVFALIPWIFQSTRLSRASTLFDRPICMRERYFNPQGSREPRRRQKLKRGFPRQFQSTRLSRASTIAADSLVHDGTISIHKALASLDAFVHSFLISSSLFQSTRLSRASTQIPKSSRRPLLRFQSTRLSRASTGLSYGCS